MQLPKHEPHFKGDGSEGMTISLQWLPVFALVAIVAWPTTAVSDLVEQPATEEIMPGVHVRTSGSVTVQARPQPCDPPCQDSAQCQNACRATTCPVGTSKLARCMSCVWECK